MHCFRSLVMTCKIKYTNIISYNKYRRAKINLNNVVMLKTDTIIASANYYIYQCSIYHFNRVTLTLESTYGFELLKEFSFSEKNQETLKQLFVCFFSKRKIDYNFLLIFIKSFSFVFQFLRSKCLNLNFCL